MKKMKYIFLLLAINFVACETVDFGDINKNVNGATEPYTAGLLSSAIMSYATYTGRDGLMKPTLYVQYQAQVTYTDEMLYAEVPASWFTWYVSSLAPLQSVIDFVSKEENQIPSLLSQGSVNNQIGVAMIMKAIIAKRVTDTYGDIPYSNALRGAASLTASYDKQEDLYKLLISELKEGRDRLNADEVAPTGDILLNGNIGRWKKLANSAILQMALNLSKKYPTPSEYAATEFNAALTHPDGLITTVEEEPWFKFENIAGFRNPWNQNRTPDYFLTREFTDALNGNTTAYNRTSNTTFDERLKVYADDYTRPGVPYGFDGGTGAGAASVSNVNYWNDVKPLPLMTASYVYLNRAEAAELGWTAENVATMLTTGITRSYQTLDYHFGTSISTTAATYAAARVADAAIAGFDQVIGEEKWVSLFGQAFDAWSEWRRTGYPDLLPATDYYNDGQIPRRYLYPIEETSLNGAQRSAGVAALSPAADKGTSKIWWDQ